jgi:hypothetical protein
MQGPPYRGQEPWIFAAVSHEGNEAFQQRMGRRNAIEGTLSELARGHGLGAGVTGVLRKSDCGRGFSSTKGAGKASGPAWLLAKVSR